MTTTLRTLDFGTIDPGTIDPGTIEPGTPDPAPRHAAIPSASGAVSATGGGQRSDTAPLDMRHVTVRHPDGVDADGSPRFHTALDDATLTLDAGTFTLLLGPSGSGKSTLLSSAAGLIVPDSGSVTIAGQDLGVLDDDDRSRIRRTLLGIVFQQPNLFASLTVMEQLLLPGTLGGATRRMRAAQADRARDLLHRVGLDGLEQRRPHQLSGGQRQRVAIARALMGTPHLLLVDEPTSALDQEAGHRIVDLLTGITHDLGTATLMVTHDQTLAPRADRLVTITDGRLAGAGRGGIL